MYRYTKIGLVATALVGAAVAALAATTPVNDAIASAGAKVSLTQAIATAEQHVGGKASRAEFEKTKEGLAYDVEVIAGGKTFDVRVHADSGVVITSAEDRADHDDNDKED